MLFNLRFYEIRFYVNHKPNERKFWKTLYFGMESLFPNQRFLVLTYLLGILDSHLTCWLGKELDVTGVLLGLMLEYSVLNLYESLSQLAKQVVKEKQIKKSLLEKIFSL